ncbi:MAG: hypothetical protein ACXAEU_15540 [Candidatus Hodarchaeales archaeon]|jgi:hypothetical protein
MNLNIEQFEIWCNAFGPSWFSQGDKKAFQEGRSYRMNANTGKVLLARQSKCLVTNPNWWAKNVVLVHNS